MHTLNEQKLSSTALSLLDGTSTRSICRVNVLFDRELRGREVDTFLAKLSGAGAFELELRPRMAMVHAALPVMALAKIAEIAHVQWVDIEKSAPLEAVMDRP